jgi:predicted O-methyltransferase YrrM
MHNSYLRKTTSALAGLLSNPHSSISWVRRGHLAKDRVFISQTYWFTGALPRVPLAEVIPASKEVEVHLPRAFDRKFGTSITVEEASHLGAIAKSLRARKVLEIGTYDGNSALTLAANLEEGGEVVTVDLPPDFDLKKDQGTLTYSDGEMNLTARDQLGRQYRNHLLSSRIRQVFGDSASLDWTQLGGPFELIFVDGCHTEAYVRSDSENALKTLAAGGAIVWHDYGMIPEVSGVVDRIAREVAGLRVYALEGTRLALGLKAEGSDLNVRSGS